MAFALRTGLRPRIEEFPFERTADAYLRMMENRSRSRAVVEMG
jgi:D-arabinose 1-dehydrogenase-like Zn-dependent alcohol dehydrogenase